MYLDSQPKRMLHVSDKFEVLDIYTGCPKKSGPLFKTLSFVTACKWRLDFLHDLDTYLEYPQKKCQLSTTFGAKNMLKCDSSWFKPLFIWIKTMKK